MTSIENGIEILADNALDQISSGLNPQPLPPFPVPDATRFPSIAEILQNSPSNVLKPLGQGLSTIAQKS